MYDEAARDRSLRRTYNITLDEYKRILASQGGRCFICGKDLEGFSNPVDHDHKSGKIRGILCSYDNRYRIGRHNDWEIVQKMADYLREPPAEKAIGVRLVPKKKPKRRRATRLPKARS